MAAPGMAPGTAPGRAKHADHRVNTVWFEGLLSFNRHKTSTVDGHPALMKLYIFLGYILAHYDTCVLPRCGVRIGGCLVLAKNRSQGLPPSHCWLF